MDRYEEVQQRIEICRKESLPFVDLRGLGLDMIPDEISKVRHIRAIALSKNNIFDLSPLASLTNLRKLALSHNRIEDLTSLGLTYSQVSFSASQPYT